MKKISIFLIAVALTVTAATGPRVSGNLLKTVENSIDQRFRGLWEDNSFALIRPTRGIYLEGYGAVFTVDVSPVVSTISLMHASMSKEEMAKAHKTRLERVPQVKQTIRLAMADAAASLDPLPADDLITFVVFLDAHQWEDVSGTPAQLTFRAKKNALLEARRGGAAALTPVVQISEN